MIFFIILKCWSALYKNRFHLLSFIRIPTLLISSLTNRHDGQNSVQYWTLTVCIIYSKINIHSHYNHYLLADKNVD